MFICRDCHNAYARKDIGCHYEFDDHSHKHIGAACEICGAKNTVCVFCRAAQRLSEHNKNYWKDKEANNA